MYRVAIACEGPADRIIIMAILDNYFDDDYEPIHVQPPRTCIGGDAGGLGGGWKGVRTWCRQEAAAGLPAVLRNADLLIIQVDADVSREAELNCSRPCPPPSAGADEVRALLLAWLGVSSVPRKVVLCVPSMASESWALVALFPASPAALPCAPPPAGLCVECNTAVKQTLRVLGKTLRPKLVVSQGGRLKNQSRGYEAQQDKIAQGWPTVVGVCTQAARFDAELRASL